MSGSRKHIATYPIYGTHPLSLRVMTNNRLGTGYIYENTDVPKLRDELLSKGHPFRIKWRNEECRQKYFYKLQELIT